MRAAIALLFLALLGGAAQAGEQVGQAEFIQGSKLYAEADYRGALVAFKRAYDLSVRPELLFNIGLCHRHLGEKQEAVEVWKHYLELKPWTSDRPEIERHIATLEREIVEEATMRQQDAEARKTKVPPTPVYRRWWLWTMIAAVLVVGAGVAVAVVLTQPGAAPPDPTVPAGAQLLAVHF